MSDLAARIGRLTPAQREVLRRRLESGSAPRSGGREVPVARAAPADRYEPFPLTEVQEVYWVGRSGYFELSTAGINVYLELELPGDEAVLDHLERVLPRLADRHQVLRLVMEPSGEQRFLEELPSYRIERVDLRGAGDRAVERRLDEVRRRFRYHEAGPGRWPLFGFLAHVLDGERIRLHVWIDCWLIDGLSRDLLVRDLFALLLDPEGGLPPLEISFREYALACRELRATDAYRRARDYWRERVATLPPPPELPLASTSLPRGPIRLTDRSLRVLEPAAWAALKREAAGRDLTPSIPLIGAFIEVLRRWSRRPSFSLALEGTFHAPVHPQAGDLVGNFNTIYLLAAEDAGGTFADRLGALQRQMTEALDHRLFSGLQVLREIGRRDGGGAGSRMPVNFNSLVEYVHPKHRERRGSGAAAGAITFRQIEASLHLPQILLAPAVFEGRDGELSMKLQAFEEAFQPGVAEGILEGYLELVRGLAADPAAWDGGTPAPPPALRGNLRTAVAGSPGRGGGAPGSFPAAVSDQARRSPDAPAIRRGDAILTYRELAERAAGRSAELRALGVTPGDAVAVAVTGPGRLAAMLAVLEAGGAALPVDPEEGRVDRELLGLGVRLVLCDPGDAARFEGLRAETGSGGAPGELEGAPAAPEAPAFVVLGERSGEPAVVLGHRACLEGLAALATWLELGADDLLLSLSPAGSPGHLVELLTPSLAGGSVRLPSPDDLEAAAAGATMWSGPPLALAALARSVSGPVEGLRGIVVLGVDDVPRPLVRRLQALAPGARVTGVTWIAGAIPVPCVHDLANAGELPRRVVGLPIVPRAVHVLDHRLQERPVGVPGRLVLEGGPEVWERRDLPSGPGAEGRPLPSEAHPETGEGLIATEHEARLRPDGALEIVGRADLPAPRRFGHPFDPGLVEAVLEEHPAVSRAVVRLADSAAGPGRIDAFVEADGGEAVAEVLRAHAALRLPPHARPARVTPVAAMPVTRHGAADPSALTASDPRGGEEPPPPPHLVAELRRMASEILGVEPAAGESFFELGGDSFRAVLLLQRADLRFGPVQDLSSFFYEPTIDHLARRIDRAALEAPEKGREQHD